MTHDEIDCIPEDRVVTYVCIVIDFCPQKEDPNRVRITAGGNLIKTPGGLTTRTVDMTTSKNTVEQHPQHGRRKVCRIPHLDFYLGTDTERYKYMKMLVFLFPQNTIDQYDMD